MVKVILTYIPIKFRIVDSFIVLARPWSSLPIMLEVFRGGTATCPGAVHMDGLGSFRCSLYPSPMVLDISPMYSSLHVSSPYWYK